MVEDYVCNTRSRYGMDKLKFNYTKNTDFVERLKNITAISQKPWFDKKLAKLNQQKGNPPNTETLIMHGIGFTFNLNDDLLNFDLYLNFSII